MWIKWWWLVEVVTKVEEMVVDRVVVDRVEEAMDIEVEAVVVMEDVV